MHQELLQFINKNRLYALLSAVAIVVFGLIAITFSSSQERTEIFSFLTGSNGGVAYADTTDGSDGINGDDGGGSSDGCGDGDGGCDG